MKLTSKIEDNSNFRFCLLHPKITIWVYTAVLPGQTRALPGPVPVTTGRCFLGNAGGAYKTIMATGGFNENIPVCKKKQGRHFAGPVENSITASSFAQEHLYNKLLYKYQRGLFPRTVQRFRFRPIKSVEQQEGPLGRRKPIGFLILAR